MPDIETEGGYEEQGQLVQTETTGLHEMRIYNQIRDQIWNYLDVLKQTNDISSIAKTIVQIQNLLNRADSLWYEINTAFRVKYAKMKVTGKEVYSGELRAKALEMDRYMRYLRYLSSRGLPKELLMDREFTELQGVSRDEAIYRIQDKIAAIVQSADSAWGESAVKAGTNLPIRAKEEQSMFFRYRKTAANPYKRW